MDYVETDASASLMIENETGVVYINNRPYAVNLIWYILEENSLYKAQLKHDAEQLETDLVCHYAYGRNKRQYGLADSRLKHEKGMIALAPTVCRHIRAFFLGSWRVDDDKWIIIAANEQKQILLDKVFSSETQAQQFFEKYRHFHQWEKIICPAQWAMEGDEAAGDLNDVLKKRVVKIERLSHRLQYSQFALFFLVLGVVSGAIYFYFFYQADDESSMEVPSLPVKKIRIPFPAKGQLTPQQMVLSCLQAIQKYHQQVQSIPGWQVDDAILCQQDKIHYSLTKSIGTQNWAEYVLSHWHEHPDYQIDGDKLTLSWPLAGEERYGDITHSDPIEVQRQFLLKAFMEYFTPLTIEPGQELKIPALGENEQAENSWYQAKYVFDSESPTLYLPALLRCHYTVIDTLSFSQSSNSWHIEGEILAEK